MRSMQEFSKNLFQRNNEEFHPQEITECLRIIKVLHAVFGCGHEYADYTFLSHGFDRKSTGNSRIDPAGNTDNQALRPAISDSIAYQILYLDYFTPYASAGFFHALSLLFRYH